MFPYGSTIEVLATGRDRHGDTIITVRGSITGCGVEPEGSSEDTDQRALVEDRVTVYAPFTDLPVTAQDRVRLIPYGTNPTPQERAALPLWSVDGAPREWRHPMTGWQPGRVIRLRLVTG